MTSHLLSLIAIFFIITVSSAVNVVVTVNVGFDSSPNITACILTTHAALTDSDACNIRSALAYCSTTILTNGDQCVINITYPTLHMDPILGEVFFTGNGTLSIYGNGAVIVGQESSRLLRIAAAASGTSVRFKLTQVHCEGFGRRSGALSTVVGGGEEMVAFWIINFLILLSLYCYAYSVKLYQFIFTRMCLSLAVLSLNGLAEVWLSEVIFSNNTCGSGSAIAIHNSSNIVLDKCLFDSNAAIDMGGAVLFDTGNRDIVIANCSFVNNTAGKSAGGLYFGINNHDMFVQDSLFERNYAGQEGGAYRAPCACYHSHHGVTAAMLFDLRCCEN